MISFRSATVAVDTPTGTKVLLDQVTCDLAERRVAVIGANGSGKSTLLRLSNGLAVPTAGSVTVDGLATTGKTAAEVRRRVGFVFTDPMAQLLMPTAVEDVELSLRRSVPDRAQRRDRALELLGEWGLGDLASSSVHDLSGGERQLVALVSVLAVEPAVVVADEPTTLLDLGNSRRLHRAFAALSQQVVVATHDLDWAATFDRVLVVEAGRIEFDGPAADGVAAYRDVSAHVWPADRLLGPSRDV